MATTGFSDVKEFQKAEVMIAPPSRPKGSRCSEISAWEWDEALTPCFFTF